MPKAVKKTTDCQRKEKFTTEELTMLTETLAANADMVFASDIRRETLIRKKAIWAEVALKAHIQTVKILALQLSHPLPRKHQSHRTRDTRTTSRGKGRRVPMQSAKHRRSATANIQLSTPATTAPPSEVNPPPQIPATEGPPSAATSSTGEAAATAALSDVEDQMEFPMEIHTPNPPGSPEATPQETPGSSVHGQSGEDNMGGFSSPPVASPDVLVAEEGAAATPPQHHSALDLASIRQRQEDITVLVGQHVEEAAHLRGEITETARHSREAIEGCTNRLCGEIGQLRQVLTRIADAMDRPFPPPPPGQTATSSSASSRQISPLRRSTRTTRRTSTQPPNASGGNGE
ncbi:myb-related transcription factor, partner of profilin-like [Ambystoma mexicanum]|uniref:myb-related transcription factor, partner of profilin-like n=1 Tax=Ambystoma mexicanum TaxID=8296 RepID=UPI0037E767D9